MALGSSITSQPGATELGQVVRGAGVFPTVPGSGGASTSVVSRVATNAANTTLLAANVNRVGASIFNNSGVNLFLKLGATANIGAGTESFTTRVPPLGLYEVPSGYTGIIDGIADAADVNGENLVTELSA